MPKAALMGSVVSSDICLACVCLGRLRLPACLPFSKPKVNWLLHPVATFASCGTYAW